MDVFDNIDALMADPKVQLATNALVRIRLRYQLPTSTERHPFLFFELIFLPSSPNVILLQSRADAAEVLPKRDVSLSYTHS